MGGFNITNLAGISGVPVVESFVNYLVDQWRLPVKMAPIAAILFGIIFNVLLGSYMGWSLYSSIIVGLLTGLFSSVYHEATT